MNLSLIEQNLIKQIRIRYGIVGDSKLMQDSVSRLIQAAPTDLSVLITGDTGTGKEVFAHAAHGLSKRSKRPFISVNCGAIPETLLESELFGHEKGAFTGAVDKREGFFEAAHSGTIFLDEIADMPVGTQVKLLRILENGEFSRLGSSSVRKVDVRVIAATNSSLEQDVNEGTFRRDLFFRLNAVRIKLPSLAERTEDIPQLISHFAANACEKLSLDYNGIAEDALNLLMAQPWPGNIRELKNLIDTAITLEGTGFISSDMLAPYIPHALPPHSTSNISDDRAIIPHPKNNEPQNYELELIFRSLLEVKNDVSDIKHYLRTLTLDLQDFKDELGRKSAAAENFPGDAIPTISEDELKLEDMEKKLILTALRRFDGNRRLAAGELGISERTLYRKLMEYGMTK